MVIKKAFCLAILCLIIVLSVQAQTDQKKAEDLVEQYLANKTRDKITHPTIKFNTIQILRSPFENTQSYKNLLHKVDSLKVEGKRIDARIAKMKTAAELNQAKKDSYRLSKELTIASDQLIDFITSYKGQQTGWLLKARSQVTSKRANLKSATKVYYLNTKLTQVDSVR